MVQLFIGIALLCGLLVIACSVLWTQGEPEYDDFDYFDATRKLDERAQRGEDV